jgi:hypothetical protein
MAVQPVVPAPDQLASQDQDFPENVMLRPGGAQGQENRQWFMRQMAGYSTRRCAESRNK